jgi:prepilin-type N-terminal cleavage/methylation domain-containing protein
MHALRSEATQRIAARLHAEDGFSLIELLVAMVILVIGIFGAVTTFSHSRTATKAGERIETLAHVAQAEAERIVSLNYDNVGVVSASIPNDSATNDKWDPLDQVVNGTPPGPTTNMYPYDWATPGTTAEPFVACTSASCVTFSSAWQDNTNSANKRFSGTMYRFITWVDDACCSGTQDYKRVTVVVTDGTTSPYPHAPFVYSTLMRDPR